MINASADTKGGEIMVRSRQFSILFRLFGLDVYRYSAMKKAPVMVSTEETDATQRLFFKSFKLAWVKSSR